MIYVSINEPKWEYDIHSLVKAFYPENMVKVLTPETKERGESRKDPGTKEPEEGNRKPELNIRVDLDETKAEVSFASGALYTYEWSEEADADFAGKKESVNRKNEFKRFFYICLSKETGKELPWGNLTGIRPTKIAMGMLEEGKTKDEIFKVFEKEHFVSREKTALAYDIAQREKKILSALHYKDGYSLYIGIPFCPSTCLYCSFTSYPIGAYRSRVEEYVDCLIEEMKATAEICEGKILDTVYIGGGTPTTLSAQQLDRMISALKEIFDFGTVQEFTVEAGRADSITKEKLEVLYRHGVSRISVNPQTMKEETLKSIGRAATAAQTIEAFQMARDCGFDNINMDIILGLPDEDESDVAHTMEKIKELGPDSLTVHSLAVKRASRLRQFIEENGMEMLKNTDATMQIASEGAAQMNMAAYYLYRQKNMSGNFENVGYATEGKAGIYNILIMEEVQTIVALGAGSITKRVFPDGRIERCDNVKDVALYIEKLPEMIERKRKLFETERADKKDVENADRGRKRK